VRRLFRQRQVSQSRKARKAGQFLLSQEEGRCCLSLRLCAFACAAFSGNGRSRKAAKPAKQGSFFCPKKRAVVAFLCVFAPLREPPFHAVHLALSLNVSHRELQ